eukprot:41161-Pelagomonas_calceolata.AAC.3
MPQVMLALNSPLFQPTTKGEFDAVVSGINRGDNCGLHVIYSGTVGAAREAACKVCDSAMIVAVWCGACYGMMAALAREVACKVWESGIAVVVRAFQPLPSPKTRYPSHCLLLGQPHGSKDGRLCNERPAVCCNPQGAPSHAYFSKTALPGAEVLCSSAKCVRLLLQMTGHEGHT